MFFFHLINSAQKACQHELLEHMRVSRSSRWNVDTLADLEQKFMNNLNFGMKLIL
jgi:hypothetical protein